MRFHGLIGMAAASAAWLGSPAPIEPPCPPSAAEIRAQAALRAERSLSWAEAESQAALQLAPLAEFFAGAKSRTPQFADAVLGFGSKWRFVADRVPFTRGGRHDAFLQAAFREHLFAPDDLTRTIDQLARSYADSLAAIENQMLVKLQADLSDLPPAALPEFADQATLATAYHDAVERTLAHVGADLRADVSQELVSLVAGEVLTQAAVRLGVSAGILSVGAGTSWATLGAGLVVGLIVDQLVSWIWDWWADPSGNLAAELNAKLDRLHALIVDGDEASPGLKRALAEFARRRAELRRAAIMELLQTGGS